MKRTLIVGDVHGCAAELNQMLIETVPNRVILVGDIFRKGPDPLGVWDTIQRNDIEAVLGNHDARSIATGPAEQGLPLQAIEWLSGLPLTLSADNWLVVHAGVHPYGGELPANHHYLLRRWPDDKRLSNPFWWELYEGSALVVYGHDARRGLVDRRPYTLGLDTGCVYGGCLTGYCVEEDRIYQVPAFETYVKARDKELGRR